MQTLRVLELDDTGLRLSEGEQVLIESPGCAALDGKRLLVGEEARARLRLDPRRGNDRFWYQLDATLATPLGEARSAADLAYAHLKSLGEALTAQPLLIAAPATFSGAQLGLLLGLLQALNARAAGLVDSAVAATSGVATLAQAVHVDAQLHRFVFTVMAGQQDLQRQQVEEHKPGLAAVHERCLSVFAQAFVRQTRFDPMHNARTEQQLYDHLPAWLARLATNPHAVLELDTGDRVHRVTVAADLLAEALAERRRALADSLLPILRGQPTTVLLSARAASVPGLLQALEPAVRLDPQAGVRGALLHVDRIATDGVELPWVTRLPRLAAASVAPPELAAATHVLVGARALPLPPPGQSAALSAWLPGAPGIVSARDQMLLLEGAQGGGVRVNGQPAGAAQPLHAGDRVAAAGFEVRLIEVVRA